MLEGRGLREEGGEGRRGREEGKRREEGRVLRSHVQVRRRFSLRGCSALSPSRPSAAAGARAASRGGTGP